MKFKRKPTEKEIFLKNCFLKNGFDKLKTSSAKKSDFIQATSTSNLQISGVLLSDKKDEIKDSVNGVSNGSLINGSPTMANNNAKSKSANSNNAAGAKSSSFKEKKKPINNATNLNNKLSSSENKQSEFTDSPNHKDVFSKDNSQDKSQDGLSIYEKIDSSNNLTKNDKSSSPPSASDILSNPLFENDTFSHFKTAKRELPESAESSNVKKKIKPNIETKESSTITASVSTMTNPDSIGFAEPGTSIVLEGAVLDEIEGVLVVNVTWRNKTYVGTLLDCTKHDWAPPRFCESPTSDLEPRGGSRNRNCKRSRGSISENENNIKLQPSKLRNGKGRRNFTVPPSPVRASEQQSNNTNNSKKSHAKSESSSVKQRSTPPLESSNVVSSNNSTCNNSLSPPSSNSQTNQTKNQLSSPALIECPEPNCNKKYKHINGLKYHQTHAHHDVSNGASKSSTNNTSSTLTSANKNEELLSESNKDNEETDTEDFTESETTSLSQTNDKNKPQSNKSNKLSKQSKTNGEDRNISNKSPAFSDISDDTEPESRPSSNSVNTSQPINNSSAKNEETCCNLSSTANSIINSKANSLEKEKSSFLSLTSSVEESNVSSLLSSSLKEDLKTNEELRKLASEVDQKLTNEVAQQHTTDKLLQNSSNTTTGSMLTNTNTPVFGKPSNPVLQPNIPMDPALHAYLIQTDLNYRLSYERYLIEHQEKLYSSLSLTDLNEIEKERHKAFLMAQNATLPNLNNLNRDSIFKLPSNNAFPSMPTPMVRSNPTPPRPSSTKSNDRPISTTTSSTTPGGSIVNGTSNLSQNKNSPSPYDFMASEFEKQREEMFRLSNTFKMEEQRILHSKQQQQQLTNNNRSSPSNKKSTKDTLNQSSRQSRPEENFKTSVETNGLPQTNFSSTFNFQNSPFLNPSSVPHFPIDPNFFRNGQSQSLYHQFANLGNNSNLPQPPSSFMNSLRFPSVGLSPIDMNSSSNVSKLQPNSQQASAVQMMNNSITKSLAESSMHQERNNFSPLKSDRAQNGLHRTLPANLSHNISQNSSSTLSTSNNGNLSTSSKKDENRSPPRLNNAQNVGVGFPHTTFIDPYGELIHQAAVTSCLIPFVSK